MKLKENYCKVQFYCTEPKKNKCVYYVSDGNNDDCKYSDGMFCESNVAQVNQLTLLLKNI